MTRKAIALAVALAFVTAGCTSDAPTAPEVIGSLSISITGLVAPVADGGTVRLVRTDINKDTVRVFRLPASGSLTVPVPLGTYRVIFEPPVSYTAVPPIQMVTVQQAVAATGVTFAVKLATGTLMIIADVNGPPWPSDGGTVSVVRTDIDGQPSHDVTIPLYVTEGYYAALDLLPGTYTLSYSPPSGFAVAAGTSDRVSVHVGASELISVTFPVVQSPP